MTPGRSRSPRKFPCSEAHRFGAGRTRRAAPAHPSWVRTGAADQLGSGRRIRPRVSGVANTLIATARDGQPAAAHSEVNGDLIGARHRTRCERVIGEQSGARRDDERSRARGGPSRAPTRRPTGTSNLQVADRPFRGRPEGTVSAAHPPASCGAVLNEGVTWRLRPRGDKARRLSILELS